MIDVLESGEGQQLNENNHSSRGNAQHDDPSETQRQILARMSDMLLEALRHPDPLCANIGALNASLIRKMYAIGETIDRASTSQPMSLTKLNRLQSAFDLYLRFARQIDRYARLVDHAEPKSKKGRKRNG